MATSDSDGDVATADDGFVTQEQYEDDTRDEQTIELTNGGKMLVQVCRPLEVVKAAQKFGVEGVLKEDGGLTDDEALGDGETTGIGPFMDNFVAPKIVRPTAYWDDPDPSDPAAQDGFDLSVLDDDDITAVIQGVMGKDPADEGDPTASGNDTTSGGTE